MVGAKMVQLINSLTGVQFLHQYYTSIAFDLLPFKVLILTFNVINNLGLKYLKDGYPLI